MPPASADAARALLRPDVLDGRAVAVAGAADHVAAACAALGAATPRLEADLLDEEATTTAAERLASEAAAGGVVALVADAALAFRAAGGGVDGLRAGLDGTWNAVRAVVNAALRPAGGGKVVLLAPRPEDGAHSAALRAALENAARTLSIEWARYAIRPTAILPGVATADADVAALCAYLVSPAGDYFSGCAFRLGEA